MGRGGKIGELDEMKRRPHLIGDSLVGLPDQIVWLDLDMVTGTITEVGVACSTSPVLVLGQTMVVFAFLKYGLRQSSYSIGCTQPNSIRML